MSKSSDSPLLDASSALNILAVMIAVGGLVVVVLGIAISPDLSTALKFVSVGLMVAFGGTVSGGLLGFLFGVPYTRDSGASSAAPNEGVSAIGATSTSLGTEAGNPSMPPQSAPPGIQYRPNTSLEQISDWLTKMIVGVGLVEIKEIPAKLAHTAKFVSSGLGDTVSTLVFAWATLIFFPVCGFIFGFLWARFNLRRLFSDADRELVRQFSRSAADGKAYALALPLLAPRSGDDPVSQAELEKAITEASQKARAVIFAQAKEVSKDRPVDDDIWSGVISVLEALNAADKKGKNHTINAELSYALSRQAPPDNKRAKEEMTKAIKKRDSLGISGWRYYEFRRARYNIRLGSANDEILTDLEAAYSDTAKWKDWLRDHSDVKDWISQNAPNLQI
jgi:hypothetical protein